MIESKVGVPVEVVLGTADDDRPIDVEVTRSDGITWRVPAFRSADGSERFRFTAPGSGAYRYAVTGEASVEHPTGALDVLINLDEGSDYPEIKRAAFLRTARKLFEGNVFCRD